MVLTGALLRLAAGRPRILLAVPAGATATRLAVERELRHRRWPAAASPAEADILVVCGRPGPELAAAADRVWDQLPLPKARAAVPAPAAVAGALDRAQADLADLPAQRGYGQRPPSAPGELPMAERGPDRDGLALDRLHVALGPVLPDWPAGLALHLTVQGDVVQQARAEALPAPGAPPAYWPEPWRRATAGEQVSCGEAARRLVARELDGVARLVAVAGWDGAALAGRRLRDGALAGVAGHRLAPRLRRYRRRVAGSWLLRWMTRGLGRLDADRGDVHDRLRWRLDRVGRATDRLDDPDPLAGRLGTADPLARPPAAVRVEPLAGLVVGTELAATRLVVASLDPDLDGAGGADA